MSEFGLDLIESTLTPEKALPWFLGVSTGAKYALINAYWQSLFFSPETFKNP